MSGIDWDKAPDGFDFFIHWENGGNFYRDDGDRYSRENGYYAIKADLAKQGIKVTRKPWNGMGLPPPGELCEVRNVSALTEWSAAKIVFASRNVVVWDWDGEPAINGLCTAYAHNVEIRPIRTPEQIEAEKRQSCIEDLAKQLQSSTGCPSTYVWELAQKTYDLGYRKPE